MKIILSVLLLFSMIPEVHAQKKAAAMVTATVIPSMTLEIAKTKIVSAQTLNLLGTGNILVVVDSKNVKSTNVLQLTTDKVTPVSIPSSQETGKTSITYLSS